MATSTNPGFEPDTAVAVDAAGQPPSPAPSGSRRSGLSELVIPALLVALAVFLIVGTVNMDLPPSVQVPGPTFFPIVVICLLLLMAAASTVQILLAGAAHRREVPVPGGTAADMPDPLGAVVPSTPVDPDGDTVDEIPPDVPPGREPWPAGAVSDWRALGTVLLSLILFIALLRPAGWILSAALLFWGVSYALGARRPVFDLSVALLMAAAVQLIFGSALGLNLPAGFLEGVL